jgi:hypothetical protein
MYSILITEGASEGAGKVVAEVRVDTAGTWKIVSTPHNPDIEARIAAAVRAHSDLARVSFRAPLGPVFGWEGFWGAAFALRLALPTVGFAVDWARLEGPDADQGEEDVYDDAPPPEEPVEWLTK